MSREAAEAAGIPVIESYKTSNHYEGSRDGSYGGSSGSHDSELQKINADRDDKENCDRMKDSFFLQGNQDDKVGHGGSYL